MDPLAIATTVVLAVFLVVHFIVWRQEKRKRK